MKKLFAPLLTVLLLAHGAAFAQSGTFNRVYNVFQTQCASCHSGSTPSGGLNLSGTTSQVHAALVNITPQNSTAAAKGQKLVFPGQPYQSFLLRKIGNGMVHEYDGGLLDIAEGVAMPLYNNPLSNRDIEIVRQWILAGAPAAGTIAAEPLVDQYYLDGGMPQLERPAPPPADKGFQIHMGPVFVAAATEKEYLLKYNLQLDEATEVKRMQAFMNQSSHHFIMYKFNNASTANSTANGLREVSLLGNNPLLGSGTGLVTVWQYPSDFRLPAGTAYFWNQNTILDLNYHIPNYSTGLILPSDVYINVYTQPAGTALKEMKSNLLLFNSPAFFTIPAGTHTLQESINNSQQWNIWMLNSHTHQYGIDFDIFRLSGGGPGEQLYEGWFDYENCQCNMGYYDWSHPPVRYFEPMLTLPSGAGLYHRATYNNTSGFTVSAGLTTNNEMMISIIQYTTGNPIPFVSVKAPKTTYCIDAPPIALTVMPEDGILDGAGIVGNTFVPANAGLGTHTITYTHSGLTAEFDIVVTPPLSTETITVTDNQLSVSPIYTNYQWFLNGAPIQNAIAHIYTPQATGAYSVSYEQYGCTAFSETAQFVISGLANPSYTPAFNFDLYPNPAAPTSYITYYLPQNASVSIAIYDIAGRKVKQVLAQTSQPTGAYKVPFLTDELNEGNLYFTKLSVNGNIYTKKFVK
ncbi:MAG TPA: T9SS type A sorting domain-containing protein [Chitinophagales bacterium]|nr:T9SS type A sorting domain-containing protein [Chitinophagales bacterium]HRK28749.1 T9SS type A sorting domain-containing protein [Chitinophagales bacterium]